MVDVWVVPGASREGVAGRHAGALRVRVAAPPEGGRANRAVEQVVARFFGVKKARIVGGERTRQKRVLIPGVDEAEAASRLRLLD